MKTTYTYTAEELDKLLKKCRRQCSKSVRAKLLSEAKGKKERVFENMTRYLYYVEGRFSNADSYFASKMLLIEFFDKRKDNEYLRFVLDVALEHLEPEDIKALKELALNYKDYYKVLLEVLEDVSTNK
jgi:hypothetical protein